LGKVGSIERRAPAGGKPALDLVEFLVLPAPKRRYFRGLVEDEADAVTP
jgi:hypothetical protein